MDSREHKDKGVPVEASVLFDIGGDIGHIFSFHNGTVGCFTYPGLDGTTNPTNHTLKVFQLYPLKELPSYTLPFKTLRSRSIQPIGMNGHTYFLNVNKTSCDKFLREDPQSEVLEIFDREGKPISSCDIGGRFTTNLAAPINQSCFAIPHSARSGSTICIFELKGGKAALSRKIYFNPGQHSDFKDDKTDQYRQHDILPSHIHILRIYHLEALTDDSLIIHCGGIFNRLVISGEHQHEFILKYNLKDHTIIILSVIPFSSKNAYAHYYYQPAAVRVVNDTTLLRVGRRDQGSDLYYVSPYQEDEGSYFPKDMRPYRNCFVLFNHNKLHSSVNEDGTYKTIQLSDHEELWYVNSDGAYEHIKIQDMKKFLRELRSFNPNKNTKTYLSHHVLWKHLDFDFTRLPHHVLWRNPTSYDYAYDTTLDFLRHEPEASFCSQLWSIKEQSTLEVEEQLILPYAQQIGESDYVSDRNDWHPIMRTVQVLPGQTGFVFQVKHSFDYRDPSPTYPTFLHLFGAEDVTCLRPYSSGSNSSYTVTRSSVVYCESLDDCYPSYVSRRSLDDILEQHRSFAHDAPLKSQAVDDSLRCFSIDLTKIVKGYAFPWATATTKIAKVIGLFAASKPRLSENYYRNELIGIIKDEKFFTGDCANEMRQFLSAETKSMTSASLLTRLKEIARKYDPQGVRYLLLGQDIRTEAEKLLFRAIKDINSDKFEASLAVSDSFKKLREERARRHDYPRECIYW